MKNQYAKNKTRVNTQSWPWYKVWTSTLFYPRTTSGEILLSKGNLSLKQAFLWLFFAALSSTFITNLLMWINNPNASDWHSELLTISRNLGSSLLFPAGVFILCGVIHFVAKLFQGKAKLQDFFIVYAAYFAPFWILLSISIDLGIVVYKIQPFFWLYLVLWIYWMFVINPKVIMSNYGFRWFGSCLLNTIVMMVFVFALLALVVTLNPSIVKA